MGGMRLPCLRIERGDLPSDVDPSNVTDFRRGAGGGGVRAICADSFSSNSEEYNFGRMTSFLSSVSACIMNGSVSVVQFKVGGLCFAQPLAAATLSSTAASQGIDAERCPPETQFSAALCGAGCGHPATLPSTFAVLPDTQSSTIVNFGAPRGGVRDRAGGEGGG